MPGIKFGVEPNMREVPPGEHAVIKLGKISEWKLVETEWGEKISFPVIVFSHPSYESISKKGIECNWVSKSVAAKHLYCWIYKEDGEIRTFDFDLEKETYGAKWKLCRHDTGGYSIEQL